MSTNKKTTKKQDSKKTTVTNVQVLSKDSPNGIDPTYAERAGQMTAKERAEIKKVLQAEGTGLANDAKTISDATIRAVNRARKIGQYVELFTGQEKLKLPAFEEMAVAVQKSLPDITLEFAKQCLAVHRKYPQEITDYNIARDEWVYVEELLLKLDPTTHGPQELHLREPVKHFVNQIGRIRTVWTELAAEKPLASWEEFYIKALITEGQPIADLVEEAKKLQLECEK